MRRIPLLTLALLCLAAPNALADWDPGMPAKWVQLPDISPTGVDVNCSDIPGLSEMPVADDFLCTETGRITGIHIWGAWFANFFWAPDAVDFTLAIHADIPADASGAGYSMPGEILWARDFTEGEFSTMFVENFPEWWLTPPNEIEEQAASEIFLYNFPIDPEAAFLQEGTPDEPVVYWLSVKARPHDQGQVWGWKSSLDHWNDDAVFTDAVSQLWGELIYPPPHEFAGQSMDMAFVIQGEPEAQADWGDAPDGAAAPGYPTLIASNGANHQLDGVLWMGAGVDPEPDGQPDPVALGDDNDGNDDEDGVTFTSPLVPGMPATVDIVASATGRVDAWIDFGLDQSWNEPGDQILAGQPAAAGPNTYNFNVPLSATVGAQTFARFRISNLGGLPPDGPAPEGEVEDHFVLIEEPREDWGDAPDAAGAPGYPTLLGNNGARHVIDGVLFMGAGVDVDANGQPEPHALGDDNDGNDDEDGVIFTTPVKVGLPATVQITASAAGRVDAWLDFDADGSWAPATDQILSAQPVVAGPNSFTFNVPATAAANAATFARFRISSAGGLPFDGPAPDGEVEDHELFIEDRYVLKWRQEPDLTPLGVDVCATPSERDYLLADDFECRTTGPLTDFVIWGSWLDDHLPFGSPREVVFTLSIHKDIPVGEIGNDYSMPGETLWIRDFGPDEFRVDLFADQIEEGFMFPPEGYFFPADWTCWRYQFHVDPHMAFIQEGEPNAPVVYWLDLKAHPLEPEASFGWKTSVEHWNDDAVWGEGAEPYPGPWFELRYPPGHQLFPASIDLAFAILEDPITGVPGEGPPERTGLRQNVPNPFNPGTEILFDMPEGGGPARFEIFDARGRLVRLLVDGPRAGGPQRVFWDGLGDDGRPQPGGVYFGRLSARGESRTIKMMLVR